jgi:PEP-CTERM motif
MKQKRLCIALAAMFAALIGQAASAQLPIVFDENTYPVNPENTFGAFTHGDFSAAGAFTDGPTSLVLDIQDSDGSNGVFGGVGVGYGPFVSGALVPHDFDPANSEWVLRLKILPNNTATALRTSYIDLDNFLGTVGDEHVFEFDLTGVPVDGNFHELVKPVSEILFTQGAFGLVAGNTINDPGLKQLQIQSIFGSTGRLNVEIDYALIRVPEPATFALIALGGLAAVGSVRRRRKSRLRPL